MHRNFWIELARWNISGILAYLLLQGAGVYSVPGLLLVSGIIFYLGTPPARRWF